MLCFAPLELLPAVTAAVPGASIILRICNCIIARRSHVIRSALQRIELHIKICQSSYCDNKAGLECCASLARPTGRTIANPQLARLRAAQLRRVHGSQAARRPRGRGCRFWRCCASRSSCSNHATSCCAMRHHSSPAVRGLCFATDPAKCSLLGLDAMLLLQLGCGRAVRLEL